MGSLTWEYSPCYQTYWSGASLKLSNIPLNCTIISKQHTWWLLEHLQLNQEKGKLLLYMATAKNKES